MPDDPAATNVLGLEGRARSVSAGDVPDAVRRRYYLDDKGGPGLGFYIDAQVPGAAFRDRGRRLVAARSDPNVIRDMTAIAQHRGWSSVVVHGDASFRREAWLAGRGLGLEVHGYRPTARDLQALDRRRTRRPAGPEERRLEPSRPHADPRGAAPDQMRIVEAVVRSRLDDAAAQARIVAAAKARISSWLERGAWFGSRELRRAPERSR